MAKQIIGKVCEYSSEVESFENYTERLDNFFKINNIKEDDKLAYFVSVMGPMLYTTLKDLLHPKLVNQADYAEAIKVLSSHFKPKVNITYERFLFNKRVQKEGESISDYSMQLKKLAASCKFDKFLDEAMRDRFLCGLKSAAIQSKLLAEGDSLNFSKALELALVTENADRNVRSLHPEKHMGDINFVRPKASFNKNSKNQGDFRPNRPQSFKAASSNLQKCYRCGKMHDPKDCPYSDFTCFSCQRKGHLSNVCKNKSSNRPMSGKFRPKSRPGGPGRVNNCESESDEEESHVGEHELYTIAYANCSKQVSSFTTTVSVNEVPVDMVIDTGAVVTVMPDEIYFKHFHKPESKLENCQIKLKTYTGESINVLGEFQANVSTEAGECLQLPVVVIESSGKRQPTLMGRNWLEKLRLNWSLIKSGAGAKEGKSALNAMNGKTVPTSELIEGLKTKYANVFDNTFGEIKNVSVDLVLKENATPIFCKARPVPFALRGAVEAELENLVKNGVIYPVTKSEWCSPIVVVPKSNGNIRICTDFKVTINGWLRTDHYPLPNPDDIFVKIAGAKVFSKIDLTAAYSQLRVSESSQELLTINTHKGLFRYARLPFGITNAGSLFQGTMDKMLFGLEGTMCYLDDILIFSKNTEEMHQKVDAVLKRLSDHGVKVNTSKSEFFKKGLNFLGYRIDDKGIHQTAELTKAITEAPRPENVTQLRSFLGLVNFYQKFLPNLSTLLHPLYRLLCNDTKWDWCDNCDKAFLQCKQLLLKDNVLIPFDPSLEIIVTCDSSSYGIGCVIGHVMPDGSERPIAFASRALTKTEIKYSQLEKESLALVYAVKKFHNFLYARKFILVTDHRPLIFLLGPTKGIPTLAAARIQRWALTLAAYRYEIRYRKGSEISNADALSRLPCESEDKEGEISFFTSSYELPITSKEIALATRYDPILSKVLDFTTHGWPHFTDEEQVKPYANKSTELSVEKGCLLWGSRVVVPPTHRKEILKLLHCEHPGESRMKSLARSFVFWPGLDSDIEQLVKNCSICQQTRKSVPLAPLQQWSWPKHNWQRIHLDFASYEGKEFLILVDSHSKWLEVFYMPSTTSKQCIEKLRHCFANFGLASTVITDGGPQFTSQEFKEFLESNGVHHTLSPPYHPASNGLAERAVQTVKNAFLKQMLHDNKQNHTRTLQHRIDSFLFAYRNTPHTMTGMSPAEAMFKFKPRTHLSLLKPHLADQMVNKQEGIVRGANVHRGKDRSFSIHQKVYVKTVRNENVNWQPGIITKVISPVTYLVKVNQRTRFVHADHLRPDQSSNNEDNDEDILVRFPREIYSSPKQSTPPRTPKSPTPKKNEDLPQPQVQEEVKGNTITLRRSQRDKREPRRLDL